jgi:hypothetical protein
VVHEEEEASEIFACQQETSGSVVVAAVAEEDSASFARSAYQGAVPIPEEGLHAGAVGDLHYYTNNRVVEAH